VPVIFSRNIFSDPAGEGASAICTITAHSSLLLRRQQMLPCRRMAWVR
jgi:hypothetical protein